MSGKLYLIPNTLGGENLTEILPPALPSTLNQITHYIVENERNARRFLLKCGYDRGIDNTQFFILNKHTSGGEVAKMLDPCISGEDMGVISEAGMPGIADPGAEIVALAHAKQIKVIPFTGPSSIILSLSASGFNGQEFRFHGYLPVQDKQRAAKIREMCLDIFKSGESQIFIETPYRNNNLLESLIKNTSPGIKLCVACDLTLSTEFISTKEIHNWKKQKPDLHKRPAVFILGK